MRRASRIWASCAILMGAAACGQKGPLSLPDKPGNVITRPAGEQTEAPPESAPQPSTTDPAREPDKKGDPSPAPHEFTRANR